MNTFIRFFTISGIISVLFFSGCNYQSKVHNYLIYLEKDIPGISKHKWKFHAKVISSMYSYYELKAYEDDTTYFLSIDFPLSDSLRIPWIEKYTKSYLINNDKFVVRYTSKGDTLYVIKQLNSSMDIDSIIFLKGKYSYYYTRGLLNLKQMNYYNNNKDSIIKTQTNDIPNL